MKNLKVGSAALKGAAFGLDTTAWTVLNGYAPRPTGMDDLVLWAVKIARFANPAWEDTANAAKAQKATILAPKHPYRYRVVLGDMILCESHHFKTQHQRIELMGAFAASWRAQRKEQGLDHSPSAYMPSRPGVFCRRLDVAIDIHGTVPLKRLLKAVGKANEKNTKVYPSRTGDTYYIGSRKSERFLRLYAYDEPHPRAGIPRFEFELKDEAAELAHVRIATQDNGFLELVGELLGRFQVGIDGLVDEAYKNIRSIGYAKRSKSGSIHWVYSQVIPALAELIRSGDIDVNSVFDAINDRLSR